MDEGGRNVAEDSALSWSASGRGRRNASHSLLATMQTFGKSEQALPKRSNFGSTALQSSWIQRLKLFDQAIDFESGESGRKPPGKQGHVWTHFTKDFSSCRRPNAVSHVRSSSWPPDAPMSNKGGLCPTDSQMLMDKPRQQHMVSENSASHRGNSRCVPGDQNRESSTKNLFSTGCDMKSSFLQDPSTPRRGSPNIPTSIELERCELKIGNLAAQHLRHVAKNERVSTSSSGTGACSSRLGPNKRLLPSLHCQSVGRNPARKVSSDIDLKGRLFSSLASAYKTVDIGGASADADKWLFSSPLHIQNDNLMESTKPLVTGVSESQGAPKFIRPSPRKCDDVRSDVLQKIAAKETCDFIGGVLGKDLVMVSKGGEDTSLARSDGSRGESNREVLAKTLVMASKAREDNSLTRLLGDLSTQKRSAGSCSVHNDSPYNPGAHGLCKSNSWDSYNHRAVDRKYGKRNVETASTMVACASRFTDEKFNATNYNEIPTTGTKRFPAENLPFLGGKTRSNVPECNSGSSSREDVSARFRLPETSMTEYWSDWMQLFEDSGPLNPKGTVSSTASLPQEYFLEEYDRFRLRCAANQLRDDAAYKLEGQASGPYSSVKADVVAKSSQDSTHKKFPPQLANDVTCLGEGKAHTLSKQILPSKRHCAPTDKNINEGRVFGLADSKPLVGSTALDPGSLHNNGIPNTGVRLKSQFPEVPTVYKTGEASSGHHAWIQRWHSSSKGGVGSGKPSKYSTGTTEKLSVHVPVKLAASTSSNTVCSTVPIQKGKFNVACSGHAFIEGVGDGSWKIRASGANAISSSASIPDNSFPGSLQASRSFKATCGNNVTPSVEAMAIVGTTARQIHTSPLQNRGFFSLWPSLKAAAEGFDSIGLPNDNSCDSRGKVHFVDMENAEFFHG